LSLTAALTYGLSDFVGGLLTRRASAWAVAATSQAAATLLALAWFAANPAVAPGAALAWGALGGLGAGAGNVLIYRGLGGGRMAVVAPISAIAAAALPVLVGFAFGERPGVAPLAGVFIALPAVWLVSGGGAGLGGANKRDVLNGVTAGLGFGVQFSALGQVPSQAGLMPLALSQVVSVTSIVVTASLLSEPWLPRDRYSRGGAVAGLLAGIATICFQFAAQAGMLTIAGVLTSLYPAVTVLLAALLLRERIRWLQGAGLLLAIGAIVLIASG
jgi:drug/metabolite transporter (DMT)-like permease